MLEMRIFAYRDAPTLQQTITHEFGHALGIDHLPQTDAIMHEMLSGEQQQLTAADVSAAQQLCQQHWR
jgi:predicted Zn-dependent protease